MLILMVNTAPEVFGASDVPIVVAVRCRVLILWSSVSVATAATNMVGQEGKLFRFTLGHSVAMTLFICVLTYLQAGPLRWMLP